MSNPNILLRVDSEITTRWLSHAYFESIDRFDVLALYSPNE